MAHSVLHLALKICGGEGGTAIGVDLSTVGPAPRSNFIRIDLDPDNLDASRQAANDAIDLFAPSFIGSGHAIVAECNCAVIVGRCEPEHTSLLIPDHLKYPFLPCGEAGKASPFLGCGERAPLAEGC